MHHGPDDALSRPAHIVEGQRREAGRVTPYLLGSPLVSIMIGGLLMGESIALLWVWDSEALRTMAALEGLEARDYGDHSAFPVFSGK